MRIVLFTLNETTPSNRVYTRDSFLPFPESAYVTIDPDAFNNTTWDLNLEYIVAQISDIRIENDHVTCEIKPAKTNMAESVKNVPLMYHPTGICQVSRQTKIVSEFKLTHVVARAARNPVASSLRQTGRSTRQIMSAPQHALYVCAHEEEKEKLKILAGALGRSDLNFDTVEGLFDHWLIKPANVVFDHAVCETHHEIKDAG
jgi:hypothetical protein